MAIKLNELITASLTAPSSQRGWIDRPIVRVGDQLLENRNRSATIRRRGTPDFAKYSPADVTIASGPHKK